ncbi:2-oxoglutarate dehydrogenase E1 component [Numidum massiliense]|uniref:2-oxoglutarate dehydrogenase E1 component n=1 Tax=Numidum massiliense TaxID=1522315 RepID=UPI0006D54AF0|nr:2-oxoglutarate dehydrogenase E1 component [Numidum massiliense]
MTTDSIPDKQSPWYKYYGPNLGYIMELYEQYVADAQSVDESVRALFEQWGSPPIDGAQAEATTTDTVATTHTTDGLNVKHVVAAERLVRNIRTYGHLAAQIYPLEKRAVDTRIFDLSRYQLKEADLDKIPAKMVWSDAPDTIQTAREALELLKRIYTQSLAYEFTHVHDVDERLWLNHMVESGAIHRSLPAVERIELLKRLTEVEQFETFLHRTFVGQKRFSIEGLDMLVPMLDEIIHAGVQDGAHNVLVGMAHRGRLNVLAHVLNKDLKIIFSEFHRAPNKELVPSEGSMGINYGWTGDVKYHLGADLSVRNGNATPARVTLANNPSHLEFVNAVVEGFTRAAQENRQSAGRPKQNVREAFGILVHGDAAFIGEGVVAETLNLSRLPGYHTGGTIHVIANNRIGFTTERTDGRSTQYASDLAKGFEIPIVHVNADDPEACLAAARLAYEYRARFHKDFLIDLVGYRRWGHNEMDDPTVTQPLTYATIRNHPTVRKQYADQLSEKGLISAEKIAEIDKEVHSRLQTAYDEVTSSDENSIDVPDMSDDAAIDVETAVPLDQLRELNAELLKRPEHFTPYPKLDRILQRRATALDEDGKIDWALAEALAFASILADGTPIRLTGQDSERGTFAHRHLVVHDIETGETYCPLQAMPQAKASFDIYNSPLSEAAVIGFEYGYNVFAPETLVLWEAQFGDFANAAQVMFDQFISAGRAKWGQDSGLVMLLPHGYEGQGPEHSSARLERFLQLAAENNWVVANLSSAAQYFHLLRRQAAAIREGNVRPLVLMSPKSLLRNPRVAASSAMLGNGQFQPILEQTGLGTAPEKTKRLILCSGKVAIDLETALETGAYDSEQLHIARVEQLYPFPEQELAKVVRRFHQLEEIVWVQEEPQNMGAWMYIEPKLRALVHARIPVRYVGRPERASTAEGLPDIHTVEQERIVTEALRVER